MATMGKIMSFIKRLPFLEFHPVILTGIVSVSIAVVAIDSYIMVNIDKLPKDLRETVLKYEKEDKEHNNEATKKVEYYTQVVRPTLYGYREPPHIKSPGIPEKEFMA